MKGHMNISEPQAKNKILIPELIFVPCLLLINLEID